MVTLLPAAAVHCVIGKLPAGSGGFQVGKSNFANTVIHSAILALRDFLGEIHPPNYLFGGNDLVFVLVDAMEGSIRSDTCQNFGWEVHDICNTGRKVGIQMGTQTIL